jgi:hypothetical protein
MPSSIEADAERDCKRAVDVYAMFAPPKPTLADRRATRADAKRRRLARYAHCLIAELDARELSGRGLHEGERCALMTALVSIRRMLG